jgi:hypothetical protein
MPSICKKDVEKITHHIKVINREMGDISLRINTIDEQLISLHSKTDDQNVRLSRLEEKLNLSLYIGGTIALVMVAELIRMLLAH